MLAAFVVLAGLRLTAGAVSNRPNTPDRSISPRTTPGLDLTLEGEFVRNGSELRPEDLDAFLKGLEEDAVLAVRVGPQCRGAVVRAALERLRRSGTTRVRLMEAR